MSKASPSRNRSLLPGPRASMPEPPNVLGQLRTLYTAAHSFLNATDPYLDYNIPGYERSGLRIVRLQALTLASTLLAVLPPGMQMDSPPQSQTSQAQSKTSLKRKGNRR